MALTTPALAGIQYMGLARGARSCRDAVMRLLQGGCRVAKVRIVSAPEAQALILTVDDADTVAIKTGLGPAGGGEGGGLRAQTLRLLRSHGSDIDEYEVGSAFLHRVDCSALTRQDLEDLDDALPLRPVRWTAYLDDIELEAAEMPHALPLGLIDGRLMDLALKFNESPEKSVAGAYRRLEAVARDRSGAVEDNSVAAALQAQDRYGAWAGQSKVPKGRAELCSEFLFLNHLMHLMRPTP